MYNEEILKKQIRNAVLNCKSMTSAARSLRINYKTFIKYAKKFGLYKPNQAGKEIYQIPIDKFLNNEKDVKTSFLKKRLIEEGYFEEKCQICGIKEWNNKKIVFDLHHVDGDRKNNRLDNLQLLCPNCHSQTDNYKGKNNKRINNKTTNENIKREFPYSNNLHQLCNRLKILPSGGNLRQLRKKLAELSLKFEESQTKKIKEEKIEKNIFCKECGKERSKNSKSKLCFNCYKKGQRRVERPSYEKLKEELKKSNFLQVGKKYGVSDNAIRKWIKNYEKEM